jgi:hypothetical protein
MARARGYQPGRFSFNVKGGRCEACEGNGVITIEMHFLPDVYVPCEECKGARYNRDTLETYKGKNISEVLDMTSRKPAILRNIPAVYEKLQTLHDVGLGYITLGQAATTLSGGEAQRVKLATELSKRQTGRTLYILDEPTTGLHAVDVDKLLSVLHRLVDSGNTVIVIEHNLDVIKTADWIIDLGPEGGDGGGRIIARARRVTYCALCAIDLSTRIRRLRSFRVGNLANFCSTLSSQLKSRTTHCGKYVRLRAIVAAAIPMPRMPVYARNSPNAISTTVPTRCMNRACSSCSTAGVTTDSSSNVEVRVQ